MALFVVHAWAPFVSGMFVGCWIGATIGCAGILLVVGRRMRQLETINQLLRNKLKGREKPQRTGTAGPGPTLVMPTLRQAERPATRIARVH
jgi:hypothetical protein